MGQVALGLRNMLVRIAVFVVMAALLAWALGGTLWPQPVSAVQRPVIESGGWQWGWQVTIDPGTNEVSYALARRMSGRWEVVSGGGPFPSAAPLSALPARDRPGVLFLVDVQSDSGSPIQLEVRLDGTVSRASSSATAAVD